MHAATYQLLVRLREFDERGGWWCGFKSCAHWLSWRTSIAPGAAREKVRVARALAQLPLLSEAMGRGELSFAKVRAATRVATPQNEQQLLKLARHGTAAHVEKVVRAWRRVNRLEELHAEGERHEKRHLTLYMDEDGSYVIRGRLDPEVGAVLERALDAARLALYGKSKREIWNAAAHLSDPLEAATPVQRRADALALVAESALRSEALAADVPVTEDAQSRPRIVGRADRFQVVVHVDAEALAHHSESGQSVLAGGVRVSAETSRRISCDASRVTMHHDTNGAVLDVGRRTRVVPSAIRRALEYRDRGCRFPGCDARFCDVHHVRHWADGGTTSLSNTALLCRVHHRAVHEGGYRLTLKQTGEVEVLRPDGRLLPAVPSAPELPEPPVAALKALHSELGLEIDPWTPTPAWHGERLDLDYAVRAFCA